MKKQRVVNIQPKDIKVKLALKFERKKQLDEIVAEAVRKMQDDKHETER